MARILLLSRSDLLEPVLRTILPKAGYLVDLVTDFTEARGRIRDLEYDGILADRERLTGNAQAFCHMVKEMCGDRVPLAMICGTVVPGIAMQDPPSGVRWLIDKQAWSEGTFTKVVLSILESMSRARVEQLAKRVALAPEPHQGESCVDENLLEQRLTVRSESPDRARFYRARSPAEAVDALSECVLDWSSVLSPPTSRPPANFLEQNGGPMMAYKLGDETLRREASAADKLPQARIFLALATARHGWRWRIDKLGVELDAAAPVGPVFTHNEDGPAIRYEDGWGIYAFQGTILPPHVIEDPELITLEEIRDVRNTEVRRFMRERFGEDRYLEEIGAELIDVDSVPVDGLVPAGAQITRALFEDDEQRRFLVGSDGSTKRVYYMEVPASCRTCQEAYEALSGRTGVRTIVQA